MSTYKHVPTKRKNLEATNKEKEYTTQKGIDCSNFNAKIIVSLDVFQNSLYQRNYVFVITP